MLKANGSVLAPSKPKHFKKSNKLGSQSFALWLLGINGCSIFGLQSKNTFAKL